MEIPKPTPDQADYLKLLLRTAEVDMNVTIGGPRKVVPDPVALEATVRAWHEENRSNNWTLDTCRYDVETIVTTYLMAVGTKT